MGSTRRAVAPAATALVSLLALLAPGLLGGAPARAQSPDEQYCLTTDPPEVTAPAHPLRFGITPLEAGSAGLAQQDAVPHDPERDVAAVLDLRPPGRDLVMRMNRMFWADGEEGIRRFAAIVDRYAAAGVDSELQVRYHPPEGLEGDMDAWEDYVRTAARILGAREHVTALSITNEANFAVSPNTSDGSYDGVVEAIVRGTEAARDELDRLGRHDVQLGFSFAWRWLPNEDRAFWEELGRLATPEFLAATDYVGLQVYPHLVWPPAPRPGVSAGEEVVEALTLLRRCFMPKAGLGDAVDVWVTENGYVTNLGRSEARQDDSLRSTVEAVHRWSGTLGVTDYRWFNLRDNRTTGTDLFDAVGLLRDDYTRKPAFDTFRQLLAAHGTPPRPAPAATPPAPTPAPPRPPPPSDASPSSGAAAPGSLPATGAGAAGTALVLLGVAVAARSRGR